MKSNFTPKLLLLAFSSAILFSCSVNDDDQPVNNKDVKPVTEQAAKSGDSTFVEGEPMIPKPRV